MKREIIIEKLIVLIEDYLGVKVSDKDIKIDRDMVIVDGVFEGAGWKFDINDPTNFWFTDIDSYNFRCLNFNYVVDLMDEVKEYLDGYKKDNGVDWINLY